MEGIMNKYISYFLIIVCMFLIMALCFKLGTMIENDVRCDYENQIEINQP